MAKFINAHVVTHDPKHVLATVNELERLGYTNFFGKKPNFRTVKCVYLFDDGDYCLGRDPFHSFYDNSHDRNLKTKDIRGAHDPIETESRDRQSVLAVVGNQPPAIPPTSDEEFKRNAEFLDAIRTLHPFPPTPLSLWAKGMAWVKAFVQRVIKHFK